ncbi:MAG: hypothetical protein ABSE41_08440 [Bacteroidota bacterium]
MSPNRIFLLVEVIEIYHKLHKFRMSKRKGFPHRNGHPVVCFVTNQEPQKMSADEAAGTEKKS